MTSAKRKKAVNLSIDADLAAEAKEFGTNMSALLETALQAEHRALRQAKWQKENKGAIETWNRLVADEGLWVDKYRD